MGETQHLETLCLAEERDLHPEKCQPHIMHDNLWQSMRIPDYFLRNTYQDYHNYEHGGCFCHSNFASNFRSPKNVTIKPLSFLRKTCGAMFPKPKYWVNPSQVCYLEISILSAGFYDFGDIISGNADLTSISIGKCLNGHPPVKKNPNHHLTKPVIKYRIVHQDITGNLHSTPFHPFIKVIQLGCF